MPPHGEAGTIHEYYFTPPAFELWESGTFPFQGEPCEDPRSLPELTFTGLGKPGKYRLPEPLDDV
jgi:hypothetical protein